MLFATPPRLREARNLRDKPHVSLLLATRGECDRDCGSTGSTAGVGRARVFRAVSSPWRGAGRALHAKHPALAALLEATTTALVRVDIEEAVHVSGVQRVTT